MFIFIVDTLIRLFLILIGVACLAFIVAVIVLSIGEKNDWW